MQPAGGHQVDDHPRSGPVDAMHTVPPRRVHPHGGRGTELAARRPPRRTAAVGAVPRCTRRRSRLGMHRHVQLRGWWRRYGTATTASTDRECPAARWHVSRTGAGRGGRQRGGAGPHPGHVQQGVHAARSPTRTPRRRVDLGAPPRRTSAWGRLREWQDPRRCRRRRRCRTRRRPDRARAA